MHLLITCFLSNISAKYYENPTMLSRVIAKNIGDVFLRHSVHTHAHTNTGHYVTSLAEAVMAVHYRRRATVTRCETLSDEHFTKARKVLFHM